MNIIIREAQPEDAAAVIAFVQRLVDEPAINLVTEPGEFNRTVEEERKYLADHAASDNSIFLVAEADGRIVGTLNCKGGTRQAQRHGAILGISVARELRNQGVGSRLMQRAIEWAKSTGVVSRIELWVFARNETAIHLYQKFGFVTEGRRRRAIYRGGEYLDDLIMALLL